MSANTDNAIRGLRDARTAALFESGDGNTTDQPEKNETLENVQTKINEAEALLLKYVGGN